MEIFDILILIAIAAVTITLGFGVYTLYRGGDFARTNSNKLMRLRIVLQAVAVLLLMGEALASVLQQSAIAVAPDDAVVALGALPPVALQA